MAIFCPYFWFWVVFWIKKTIFCPYFWIFHFSVSVTKQATRPLVMVGRIVILLIQNVDSPYTWSSRHPTRNQPQ